jgi:hypothetical protein
MTRTKMRRTILALALPALLMGAAACSRGGGSSGPSGQPTPRPSSSGKVEILAPTNGQVFHGSPVDVPIKLGLTGARIVPATTTDITPDTGHIHLYLDNQIVTMNFSLTGDIPNVTPGQHILRAEFVASDHLPFNPRVFVSVTFVVQP